MKTPQEEQNKRLIRIILISWFLGLIAAIALISWGTVKIAQIENRQVELANRPTTEVKIIEKQLQPIYTTIAGERGDKGEKGDAGQDSLSTHTEVTTVIKTETAIPGPAGPTGKTGKAGANGRDIEMARDEQGNFYQRPVGTTVWFLVPIIDLQP